MCLRRAQRGADAQAPEPERDVDRPPDPTNGATTGYSGYKNYATDKGGVATDRRIQGSIGGRRDREALGLAHGLGVERAPGPHNGHEAVEEVGRIVRPR